MPAFKLFLQDGDELELYFQPGDTCELSIGKDSTYEFQEKNGAISVTWTFQASAALTKPAQQSEIKALQLIPFTEDKIEKSGLIPFRNRCCSFGTKEYCIKNGCVQAPCGQICG